MAEGGDAQGRSRQFVDDTKFHVEATGIQIASYLRRQGNEFYTTQSMLLQWESYGSTEDVAATLEREGGSSYTIPPFPAPANNRMTWTVGDFGRRSYRAGSITGTDPTLAAGRYRILLRTMRSGLSDRSEWFQIRPATLALTSPARGAGSCADEPYTIRWTADHVRGPLEVYLDRGGGNVFGNPLEPLFTISDPGAGSHTSRWRDDVGGRRVVSSSGSYQLVIKSAAVDGVFHVSGTFDVTGLD